jgi:glycerophosphoryl diester phosphodiesterase
MTRTLAELWKQWRPLMAFALAFQLVENFLFTPAMGLLGRALQGRPVVDSTGLVGFFLSPRGFLILYLGTTVWLTIRLVEHAGLSALVIGALEGRSFRLGASFRWLAGEMPRLVRIGARGVAWGLAVSAPFAVVAGLLAGPLLAKHDINYYLANRPPEFVSVGVVLGVLGVATLCAAGWLLVRWRLVVQVCVFERRGGGEAFREAAVLSRGVRWRLLGRCLAVIGVLLALMVVAAELQQLAVWLLLRAEALGAAPLAVSFGVALVLRTAIGAGVTAVGACVGAAVFTVLYRERRLALGGKVELPGIAETAGPHALLPAGARVAAAATAIGVVAAAGVSVALVADGLRQERPTTVTAHRGAHDRAPENTAAAIREAIAAKAHCAEIDVQISKDGVLVVTHDSDFSRMGGVAKKVWDLSYEEIRAIPLGAKSAVEFRNEPAPTLDEVLALARDRIRLNVELKYYGDHQPRLAERVVEAVRAHGMTNQVEIQCLEYEPLMEVRRVAPDIPVGYLMSVNAKQPGRLSVDFLSVQLGRVTGAFIGTGHRRGQGIHVWTVNKPADMERMIALGADALITDEPAEALRCVQEWEGLTRAERAVTRVEAWLAD